MLLLISYYIMQWNTCHRQHSRSSFDGKGTTTQNKLPCGIHSGDLTKACELQFPMERYLEDLPALKQMTQDSLVTMLKRYSNGFTRCRLILSLTSHQQCPVSSGHVY